MKPARGAPDPARDAIDAWFAAQPELRVEPVGDHGWFTVLRGDHKRTIPVYVELGARDLTLESFFMAAPDENAAEVFAYLLRRNTRTYTLRFAIADSGDLMLIGIVPRAAINAEELDRLFGQLLVAADETYNSALRKGFAAYIEREQAWRAKVGAPRNPIS